MVFEPRLLEAKTGIPALADGQNCLDSQGIRPGRPDRHNTTIWPAPEQWTNRISTVRQPNPCIPGANLTSEFVRPSLPRDTYGSTSPRMARRSPKEDSALGVPKRLKWKVTQDGTMADSHFGRR